MSLRNFVSQICLIIFLLAQVSNVSSQTLPPADNSPVQNSDEQSLIHVGDVLDVDVIGSTEYDWRGRVTSEGFITGIDYIDEAIPVVCRHPREVADLLVKGFSKILRDPKVSVRIIDRSDRPNAFIYGAVKTPQRFSIQRAVKISELIILSGGFTDTVSGEIEVVRPTGAGCQIKDKTAASESSSKILLKVSDILAGVEESDIIILNGDIITVTESEPIYIIGGVANPSTIKVRTGLTLTKAIAIAGGLAENNNGNDIIVYRRDSVGVSQFKIDLDDIKSDKIADLVLQKYDVVEVSGKNSRQKDTPPVIKTADISSIKNVVLPLRIIN